MTLDGVGEWSTSSYGVGRGHGLDLLAELHYPHSLGMLYSAFTYYTGSCGSPERPTEAIFSH
jgi:carbamoyltransferase